MSNQKKEEKKDEVAQKNKKHIDDAAKELLMEQTSASSSKSKLEAYCQGKGFSYLSGKTQSETCVVKPQFAREKFLQYLQTCANIMSEKYKEINNFRQEFNKIYANDFQRKVFPHVNTNKKEIKILCLDFIKKKEACFMSYIIMNYSFELAPNIIKQTIEKTSSESMKFGGKIGPVSLGFSSSSSSSYSEEKLIEKERGMTLDDMAMLIQLANVDNKKRQTMLEMFIQDKFSDEINY